MKYVSLLRTRAPWLAFACPLAFARRRRRAGFCFATAARRCAGRPAQSASNSPAPATPDDSPPFTRTLASRQPLAPSPIWFLQPRSAWRDRVAYRRPLRLGDVDVSAGDFFRPFSLFRSTEHVAARRQHTRAATAATAGAGVRSSFSCGRVSQCGYQGLQREACAVLSSAAWGPVPRNPAAVPHARSIMRSAPHRVRRAFSSRAGWPGRCAGGLWGPQGGFEVLRRKPRIGFAFGGRLQGDQAAFDFANGAAQLAAVDGHRLVVGRARRSRRCAAGAVVEDRQAHGQRADAPGAARLGELGAAHTETSSDRSG